MGGLNTIKAVSSYHQVLYCPRCKNALKEVDGEYFCQNCAHYYPIVDGIPSLVDQNMIADSFDAAAFEFLFEMEQRHFWHIGRKEIILDVLLRNIPSLAESKMLEIGCGNGSVLAYLKQHGIDIVGGDILLEGLELCRQRSGSAALYQTDIQSLPFRNEFDIIGIFDVLEHIDNDDKALSEINQALKPGGNLILTVPANKFLWSYFDIQSHHKRRYNKKELMTKLERNGFTTKKISFFMFFLFPLFAAIRVTNNILHGQKDKKQNAKASLEVRTIPLVNDVFLGLLRLERRLIRYVDLPFGASLLVLAERK